MIRKHDKKQFYLLHVPHSLKSCGVVLTKSFGFRFISEDSIEEGIYSVAQEKLKLEQDVTGQGEEKGTAKKKDVARLLKVSNLLSESKSMEFINNNRHSWRQRRPSP